MAKSELFARRQAGGVVVINNEARTTGNIFFVNGVTGTDSASYGVNPDFPFATINYALSQCTANNGDYVYVMPGHTETVSLASDSTAAAGMLTCKKAGIQVVGLGNGGSRPNIVLSATASTILVSAADVWFKNFVIKVSVDEVVSCWQVQAARCILDAVDFVETSAKQLIQFLVTTAAGTDLQVINCVHHQSTAAAANTLWIQLVGADRCKIINNKFFLTTTNSASSSVIESDTTAPVNILLENLTIVQLGGTGTIPVNLVAGSSGFAKNVTVASAKTAIAGSIALASLYASGCYASHVVNKNGLLEPVVDA